MIKQLLAALRPRRVVEGWSASATSFGGDSEVADQQDRSAGLRYVQIEVLVAVAEDSQTDQLLREPLGI